eukprot:gene14371-10269_t
MEFEITSDGKLRYANNSNYKKDFMIRKEVMLGPLVIEEIKRIIRESDVTNSDDSKWPAPDKDGRQELEVRMDREHISFTSAKIGSLMNVQDSEDPEGYRNFYYLIQDLKCLILSLISLHFKIKPIP